MQFSIEVVLYLLRYSLELEYYILMLITFCVEYLTG